MRVAVMVLNYNGLRWLPNCLSSIANTDYPNLDIYLVDNGSTDESVDYVQKRFPGVKIIRYGRNLGYAEGYDRAIEKVEADYVLLMNTDTQVLNTSWVKCLVDAATADSRIAAVASKLVSMEDHSRLDSVGGMGIPFWRGFVDIGRKELDQRQYDSGSFEPFSFCGAAALIRRNIFVKVGGFDGRFFLFSEEPELCWRLRLLGYCVAFAPEAKVAHYFSGTFGDKTVNTRRLYYCHRHLLTAILKNCGSSLPWALNSYFLLSLIAAAGFLIYEPRKAIVVARAILWNLLNFRYTYAWRLRVQASRVTSEEEILSSMYLPIKKCEPSEHVYLRRILACANTSFMSGLREAFLEMVIWRNIGRKGLST